MPSRWKTDRPMSRQDFEARFPDEEACARYLVGRRWPDGFVCPGCGHASGWALTRARPTWECSGCGRQTSVTAGTIMHRTPTRPGPARARRSSAGRRGRRRPGRRRRR
ncbi:MAG: transposase [Phenylobacterium sp.]|nr:transposase [Phenylobacterium sp.]